MRLAGSPPIFQLHPPKQPLFKPNVYTPTCAYAYDMCMCIYVYIYIDIQAHIFTYVRVVSIYRVMEQQHQNLSPPSKPSPPFKYRLASWRSRWAEVGRTRVDECLKIDALFYRGNIGKG